MSWHLCRMVAYDCETTGVDLDESRIVTAAVVAVGAGVEPDVVSLVADPGVEIPTEASDVHGFTTERAREEGAPAAEVVEQILATLRPHVAMERPIVAMNARFDLTILDREARRHGLEPLQDALVVDPYVIDKHLHRFRRGSRKLDALAAHYDAVLSDAHEAEADAIAAARIAWRIAQRGEVIRRVRHGGDRAELEALRAEWAAIRHDLPRLHAAQVLWAAEQAESLEDYLRQQGTLEAPVEREWPVVSYRGAVAA